MRINLVIEDQLMSTPMRACDIKTNKDVVKEDLRLQARRKVYQNLRALRGKLHWSVDGHWSVPENALKKPQPASSMVVKRLAK
jgi:hypothetical protein